MTLQNSNSPLPLSLLLRLHPHIAPTSLSTYPHLHSLLLSLPLSPNLSTPIPTRHLATADEALSLARDAHTLKHAPHALLLTALPPPSSPLTYLATLTALMHLSHAAPLPPSLLTSLLQPHAPSYSPDAWDKTSENIATTAATLLNDLFDVWTTLLPPSLHPPAPSDLAAYISRARAASHSAREKRDAARAQLLLCASATARAEREALRRAAAALERRASGALEKDAREVAVLEARADATVGKVRLVRVAAMRDAYCGKGVVGGLRLVRGRVEERKEEVGKVLDRKEGELERLKGMPEGFGRLVEEWARLESEKVAKVWSLEQLREGDATCKVSQSGGRSATSVSSWSSSGNKSAGASASAAKI